MAQHSDDWANHLRFRSIVFSITALVNRRSAAILFVLMGCVGCARPDAVSQKPPVPDPSVLRPASSVLDLDGQPVDVRQLAKGKPFVLLFTRTDCPVSNRLAPEICQLVARYYPQGVEFFLVYVDPLENSDSIRIHLKEYGYPCTALRDPEHQLVVSCGATVTPEAAVFDRQDEKTYLGRITDQWVELGTARPTARSHDLADAIEATVNDKPVATPRTRAVGCTIADLTR